MKSSSKTSSGFWTYCFGLATADEVNDDVRLANQPVGERSIAANVAVVVGEAGVGQEVRDLLFAHIRAHQLGITVLEQPIHQVGADEASATEEADTQRSIGGFHG